MNMKKIICLLSLVLTISLLCGNGVTYAAENVTSKSTEDIKSDTQMSLDEIREYYGVDELAMEYGVDAQKLAENIYEGIHSDRFAPFENLEVMNTSKSMFNRVIAKGSPVYSQDSTMYLETGNPCASGNYPYVGCVAVHRKSKEDRTPIIAFGTRINYLSGGVNISGTTYTSFIVEDTGDANFTRSTYWTDIYGGANTQANRTMAYNYGVKTVVISWN